jgi:hypothetical protein
VTSDQTTFNGTGGHSAVLTTHYGRVLWYRGALFAVLSFTALAAASSAIFWPMEGNKIQAPFFLSLAGTSLTLFGLVFTLCLIGTQLIATRTNVTVKRIFGILTWFYLALFLMTTLWTLATSYYAGNVNASPKICRVLAHSRICISEVHAGRISIFGLSWSLLLLLPFVIYMYYRLSPRYVFTTLVSSSLRMRNAVSFKQRCRRVSDEIMSVAADPRAVAEGLSQLLELGVIGTQRRPKGSLTPDDVGRCVTEELVSLNYKLIRDAAISAQVLEIFEKWILWLIYGGVYPGRKSPTIHNVPTNQVGLFARMAVKSVTRNLRLWETSSDTSARESIHLLQEIVQACVTTKAHIRVRISEAIIQLADCILIKLVDGPRTDFNLALRSMIRLCELTMSPGTWYLGGEVAVRQATRTLKSLGEANDSRGQLSSWVLDELHNLTDQLSQAPSLEPKNWQEFLRALAVLKDEEIRAVLRGTSQARSHRLRGISHAWEAEVIGQLYATGRSAALIASQKSAVGLCGNSSDLRGLIALFEQFGIEYIDNYAGYLGIQQLLTMTAGYIRTWFHKNQLIASARGQRLSDQHHKFSASEGLKP